MHLKYNTIQYNTIQYNTLFTHATSRSDKNSLKHVRETKSIEIKEIV